MIWLILDIQRIKIKIEILFLQKKWEIKFCVFEEPKKEEWFENREDEEKTNLKKSNNKEEVNKINLNNNKDLIDINNIDDKIENKKKILMKY